MKQPKNLITVERGTRCGAYRRWGNPTSVVENLPAGKYFVKGQKKDVFVEALDLGNGRFSESAKHSYVNVKDMTIVEPEELRYCIVVQCLGYWGRGKTLKEAATNCREAGARALDSAVVDLFIGDDRVEVVDMLHIRFKSNTQRIRLATNTRLRNLMAGKE